MATTALFSCAQSEGPPEGLAGPRLDDRHDVALLHPPPRTGCLLEVVRFKGDGGSPTKGVTGPCPGVLLAESAALIPMRGTVLRNSLCRQVEVGHVASGEDTHHEWVDELALWVESILNLAESPNAG